MTEGILPRLIEDDPGLEGVGLVIFDEFHERSLEADLGLALALDSRRHLRGDLRLLVMSATIEGDKVARLLGECAGGGKPGAELPGRQFGTLARPMPDRFEVRGGRGDRTRALKEERRQRAGVPTRRRGNPARGAAAGSGGRLGADVSVAPLYGDLAPGAQDEALLPSACGPAESGAGDLDRRNQPDHRGHPHRHR
jgi:ATP-dependent helicase HrpB